jgi:4-aminobutyrate--pyruvate transaminase
VTDHQRFVGAGTKLSNSIAGRDIAYLLHPSTDARAHEASGPKIMTRGKGIFVYDDEGKEFLEAMAGLWCVALGFSEPRLVEAAKSQLERLPFYHVFYGKSHTSAVDLAEALVKIAPGNLNRVYFTNSGSEANDTAMKLVWYYNNARGRPLKKKIIARDGGYHGSGVGSGSLTGRTESLTGFDLPIAGVFHTTCPNFYRLGEPGETEEQFASRCADDLERLITAEGPDTVAAFIGEPVIGGGGVILPPKTYWKKIQKVCRKYDVLVIADEVITGFGRTGRMFASELYDIQPDMMVLSKQLTSSYLPLGALMFTDEIYQNIADYSHRLGAFVHGFTSGGNPVATAVGLECLRIIQERDLVGHVETLAPHFQARLNELASHPLVGTTRGVGFLGAVELVADKKTRQTFEPEGRVGSYFYNRSYEHGMITRSVKDVVALCPPLIISGAEIDDLFDRFGRTLDDTWRWVEQNRDDLVARS